MGRYTKLHRKKRFNLQNLKQFTPIVMPSTNLDSLQSNLTDDLVSKLDYNHLSHLKELILSIAEKPHIAKRLISTFTFGILRINGISYNKTKEILESIGCCEITTASKWANVLRNSDDPLTLLEENRKYKGDDFYQLYPEIKAEAIIFSQNKMKQKIANFKARDLSKFINEKYTEISGQSIEEGVFLRSERNCRRDLLKWGAKFECNKKRPYFEGHERPDVKEYRKEFVKLFDIKKKDFGYLQKMDEKMHTFLEKSIVRIEEQKKIVLICHDESTFRLVVFLFQFLYILLIFL